MGSELKPCPFCGGEAAVEEIKNADRVSFSVGCLGDEIACMGFQSLTTFARRCEAEAAWNRRSEPRGDSPLAPEGAPQLASGGNRDPEPSSAALPPLPPPAITFADHSYPAFSAKQMEDYARAAMIASAPKAEVEGWRDIASAPRDGTVFVGCNLNHPSFGSWAMYRRVRYSFDDDGNPVAADAGAWAILHGVEPDLQEGYPSGPEGVAVIAPDALNTSVRYGWRPLPAPAERTASPVADDDRTQAASEASDPPTRDGADKPVEGEGG